MSKTLDALKRQVGRDAGKVVSNFMFGNSHSTPHRNTNAENTNKKLEFEQQGLKQKDLYLLDGAVINAVNQVISIDIPDNEKEIIKVLQELEIQLKVNKWTSIHNGEISKIRNKYPDAVLTKYEQCVYELTFLDCNQNRLKLVSKILSKYKRLRFFNKYKLFIAIFILLVLFIIAGLNE